MYQRRTKKESAVSPVVGVMLMLVVTIVIAAVVTVFASGLATTQQSAPTLAINAKIINGGNYYDTYFDLEIISVSEPVKTSDLKLTTTWFNKSAGAYQITSTGDIPVNWTVHLNGGKTSHITTKSPWGYGNGVAEMNAGLPDKTTQGFGNYTLLGGAIMHAYPAGQNGGYVGSTVPSHGGYYSGTYSGAEWTSHEQTDGMQSILGYGWERLTTGDIVNVKLTYLPSGTVVFEKDVTVS